MKTNIQLDFGDGIAVSYSNLSWTEDGIRHVYKTAGIFRVMALAENSLGSESSMLFLHVTCKCQPLLPTLKEHPSISVSVSDDVTE